MNNAKFDEEKYFEFVIWSFSCFNASMAESVTTETTSDIVNGPGNERKHTET